MALTHNQLIRLTTHLVTLERRTALAKPEEGRRPTKAYAVAMARYKEACVTTSLVVGGTSFAVDQDVLAAVHEAGEGWQGRMGADIDAQWQGCAADALAKRWGY